MPSRPALSAAPTVELLARRIRVARGQEPGDLLIAGGQVVNVFTGQVERADVVIADGWIAGVGPYAWTPAKPSMPRAQFVLPGLIDAHMHLESTLLTPAELARVVVPHGTTTIVADPHEVGNVLGVPGIELLLAASAGLPLDIFFMAPSCVPCTAWEHAGATLTAADVARLLAHPRVLGLAEVMDFPAVLAGEPGVLAKVVAALSQGAAVDGHAPEMIGPGSRGLCGRRHSLGPRIDDRSRGPGQGRTGHAGASSRRERRPAIWMLCFPRSWPASWATGAWRPTTSTRTTWSRTATSTASWPASWRPASPPRWPCGMRRSSPPGIIASWIAGPSPLATGPIWPSPMT